MTDITLLAMCAASFLPSSAMWSVQLSTDFKKAAGPRRISLHSIRSKKNCHMSHRGNYNDYNAMIIIIIMMTLHHWSQLLLGCCDVYWHRAGAREFSGKRWGIVGIEGADKSKRGLVASSREAGAGERKTGNFGGRQRIVPATRKQKWGPLLRASLRTKLRRPAEKRAGEGERGCCYYLAPCCWDQARPARPAAVH